MINWEEYGHYVTGNNYPELFIRTNKYDRIIIQASDGNSGRMVHLEFTERHKINALINILTNARNNIFREDGRLVAKHYEDEKENVDVRNS